MSWKKSLLYFTLQTFRYAGKNSSFGQLWSYYGRWKNTFQQGRNSVVDELPWINFPALDFLEQHIQPTFRVFEFGGGGSTLFFCKKAAEVITVEDHAEWFKTLTDTVKSKGYNNWQGFFIAPETVADSPARAHTNPADFKSGAKGLEHLSFEKYARAIDAYPAEYFDLVLVDGRARPSCIQQALPHLKSGGLLVVDNTERPYYLAPFRQILDNQFDKMVETQAPVAYTPDFTITSIYKKH
jgi:hypothetical protein